MPRVPSRAVGFKALINQRMGGWRNVLNVME